MIAVDCTNSFTSALYLICFSPQSKVGISIVWLYPDSLSKSSEIETNPLVAEYGYLAIKGNLCALNT